MSQRDKVIEFATAQVGYKETPVNRNKYAEMIDKDFPDFYNGKKNGSAWCDEFVDACFLSCYGEEETLRLLCQPKKSCGAGCKFSAGYFKAKKQFYDKPEPGDQIFFIVGGDINHTGIVTKVDDKKVYTVEGNSGDAVKAHSYSLSNPKIAGYGRPAWNDEVVSDPVVPAEPVAAPAPAPDPEPVQEPILEKPNNSDTYYTVVKGDTLSKIARHFGTSVAELQALNRLSNPNLIYPGEKILLPKSNTTPASGKPTFIGQVNTLHSSLNVRSGASMSYPIVRRLSKGSTVEVYSDAVNGWYRLTDGSGFVAGNYIKRI